MTNSSGNITLTDIARRAGVRVSAASNWRKRHTDFPQPTVIAGQELFAADEVAGWLGQRRIARNDLRPDELAGTTYGDRFMSNEDEAGEPRAGSSYIHAASRPDWANQLWQIMDSLRTSFDFESALDFIMAMLYLRTTNRELWRVVAEQRSWHGVNSILRDAPVWAHDVPLFSAAASDLSNEHQLVEVMRRFDEIDLSSVGSASIFDALLEKVNRDLGKHGGHFTPSSVVRCMVDVLDPQSSSTLYDPSCGSGELLVAAAQRGVGSLFGQAMNGRSLRMTLFNLSMHGSEAELRIGGPEIASGAFAGEQFDFVLANPPFNMTLPEGAETDNWPFEIPNKGAASFAWLQVAVHKLKPGGRAGVLMPNGTLFRQGVSAEVRRKMVDAGAVEGIIALPAGLFAATGISVSLWLVRSPQAQGAEPPEILFIDAEQMGTNEGARRVLGEDEVAKIVQAYRDWRAGSDNVDHAAGFARSATIDEIRENDYKLQPPRYVREEIDSSSSSESPSARLESLRRKWDEVTEQAERTRREIDTSLVALLEAPPQERNEVALGDICDIRTGPGKVDRERRRQVRGWTPIVLPRNIKRGYLDHNELDTVSPPDASAKLMNYTLRPGDIVCPRSGTLGRHGLVREKEDGWLLGPSCMRLRPGDEVVPEYLVHYLNSPTVHALIRSESHSSTAIPHISAATLGQLVISLPPIAAQKDIAATMDSIDVHIEQHQRATSTTKSLRDLVFPLVVQT